MSAEIELHCVIPPAQVIEVIVALKELGHTAYIAGGAVRDMVMASPVRGWVWRPLPAEQVMAAFAR